MGRTLFSQNSYVKVLTSGISGCDLLCKLGLYRDDRVKVGTLKQALLQQDWCPDKEWEFRDKHANRKNTMDHEYNHLQATRGGLEQTLPSQPPEGSNSANNLILDS